MSTQINQTTGSSTPPRNNTWIYLAVIAVLLGACIYLYVKGSRSAEQQKMAMDQRDSVTLDRNAIKSEYDAALARLDDLVSKNTALNNEINDKDGEISKMKKELQGIMAKKNATAEELRRAKKLIEDLNEKTKSYEERIAQLEGQVDTLTKTNVIVSRERDSISTEAVKIKKLGSVLHASNIRMVPIHTKNNGKEKETGRARRTDKLRVIFDIDENRVAENGNKELFFRIVNPQGTLLSNAAYGSGITSTAEGASLNYTMQREIPLVKGQKVADVSIDWRQESDYAKGDYMIEIYNEGYKIGSGSVHLK